MFTLASATSLVEDEYADDDYTNRAKDRDKDGSVRVPMRNQRKYGHGVSNLEQRVDEDADCHEENEDDDYAVCPWVAVAVHPNATLQRSLSLNVNDAA